MIEKLRNLLFQGLTEAFQRNDKDQRGVVEISYEEFLEMVLQCNALFS